MVLERTKVGLRGARVDFEFAEGYISEISKRNLHQLAPAIMMRETEESTTGNY